ncbi:4a-hydroxytetrahydrobiopterin dehydratase [Paenibacillus whitsoniae]|uniref:Putative pterin-4-alpha-carbinolamine dehydratase n=1 Tax=Paenibacillus whitsoniae TaxID=2496558 RepID=A0A430JDK1_9BACL|nr:4a-hydroxytetrahydrobiopterin dehydratase [Paenibacillus whitsoniae]RTE09091.1 4a-hydroxytetrahydrobiopterin dehydratase [Paenibacillus whitsoniae]
MAKLDKAEVEAGLLALPGWSLEAGDDKWITRKYRFGAFLGAIAFVNEVARLSEAANHHPMIAIDYRMVTLRLTTWSAGGLTPLDLATAAEFDAAFERQQAQP